MTHDATIEKGKGAPWVLVQRPGDALVLLAGSVFAFAVCLGMLIHEPFPDDPRGWVLWFFVIAAPFAAVSAAKAAFVKPWTLRLDGDGITLDMGGPPRYWSWREIGDVSYRPPCDGSLGSLCFDELDADRRPRKRTIMNTPLDRFCPGPFVESDDDAEQLVERMNAMRSQAWSASGQPDPYVLRGRAPSLSRTLLTLPRRRPSFRPCGRCASSLPDKDGRA